MIRKFSILMAAVAVLSGCASSGYGYRGGSGDYYYGRAAGGYYGDYGYDRYDRYGYGGYGGYGYGPYGYGGFGYPYSYYYGGHYDYPYHPVRPRPPHGPDRPRPPHGPPRSKLDHDRGDVPRGPLVYVPGGPDSDEVRPRLRERRYQDGQPQARPRMEQVPGPGSRLSAPSQPRSKLAAPPSQPRSRLAVPPSPQTRVAAPLPQQRPLPAARPDPAPRPRMAGPRTRLRED